MPTRLHSCGAALLLLLSMPAWADGNRFKLQLKDAANYRVHSPEGTQREAPIPAALAAKPYAREIEAAARASRLDPILVHALIHVESGHRRDALSSRGAMGLMQVLPETAARFGITRPDQVRENLRAGTRYLRALLDRFDQRLDLALAAYNAGEGAIDRYKGIPPYAETRHYVPAVLSAYEGWRGGEGMQPALRYAKGSTLPPSDFTHASMAR